MAQSHRIILVAGATGRQGGAVANHLLRRGWQVRAMTRDAGQPKAQELAERGAEVVEADMDVPESLAEAFDGVHGVFSVQNFWEVGKEREIAEGKAMAEAAAATRVHHFVYSSVGSAHRQTGLAHFDSKYEIEQHIHRLGLPYTIFRPVYFMDNLLGQRQEIEQGRLRLGLRPDIPLQMIAVDDIGAFVTRAFEEPGDWIRSATDIAGDELTMPEVCRRLTVLEDHAVTYEEVPYEQGVQQNRESAEMFRWFNDYGYEADIAALRERYPGLRNFDHWAESYWPAAVAAPAQ